MFDCSAFAGSAGFSSKREEERTHTSHAHTHTDARAHTGALYNEKTGLYLSD